MILIVWLLVIVIGFVWWPPVWTSVLVGVMVFQGLQVIYVRRLATQPTLDDLERVTPERIRAILVWGKLASLAMTAIPAVASWVYGPWWLAVPASLCLVVALLPVSSASVPQPDRVP